MSFSSRVSGGEQLSYPGKERGHREMVAWRFCGFRPVVNPRVQTPELAPQKDPVDAKVLMGIDVRYVVAEFCVRVHRLQETAALVEIGRQLSKTGESMKGERVLI